MKNKIEFIQRLDLNYIIVRMIDKKSWSPVDAEATVRKYKNFLILKIIYPQLSCVPTSEIDEIWHEHILHTKNYMRDCEQIFGHFLHHNPSDGSDDDKELLAALYNKTKQLYEEHFQESFGYSLDIF